MKLGALCKEAGITLPRDICYDTEITGVCSDSRTVSEGEVFVALRGLHCDGAQYASEALARGAATVVAEVPLEGVNVILVSNARAALSALLDAWYGHPTRNMKLIGITGTNGKTSSALMLFHILRRSGECVGLIGTLECRVNEERIMPKQSHVLANMTTPDPEQLYALLNEMRCRGVSYVVMEVTSHALALEKVTPLRFLRAIFTNLTPDHLDLHGDMEAYFGEKCKLFERCDAAVISRYNEYGARLWGMLDCTRYDVSERTVKSIVQRGADGVTYTLCLPCDEEIALTVSIPGQFSVENSALAATCAYSLGVESDVIREALITFPGVRGRMERVGDADWGVKVFIDYAHTPDALCKLLLAVREFAEKSARIVVLFGCGGDRDRTKRPEMGRIASALADFTVITSDNCRSEDPAMIISDIMRGVDKEKPHAVIPDRREAIFYAVKEARRGDILLLAGKGHEEYEIRGNTRLPFFEREIVRAAMQARSEEGK